MTTDDSFDKFAAALAAGAAISMSSSTRDALVAVSGGGITFIVDDRVPPDEFWAVYAGAVVSRIRVPSPRPI